MLKVTFAFLNTYIMLPIFYFLSPLTSLSLIHPISSSPPSLQETKTYVQVYRCMLESTR